MSTPLAWNEPPAGTQSFVMVMDDPDAPGVWDHWVVFNLPASLRGLAENQPKGSATLPSGGLQGKNSWGNNNYGGPCPPSGTPHSYRFTLYAADTTLTLDASATKAQVLAALSGHILAQSVLRASYQRVY